VNDFQDRGPVHQVVFRWDGNQGRQGTGMNAVAHSCDAGRAEELGRELGSLLWVSGTAAARPSVVRTLSRDGDVLLVQRWPTKDRGGRPSTISHVLAGDRGTLNTERCLGLAYRGWCKQESAEQALRRPPEIDPAELEELAGKRLPEMVQRLPEVAHALTLATAELLRDPEQRVSLLLEKRTPSHWPTPDTVPVVYLGLFLIFGTWLRQTWTFATYDTVDSHPLRLMAVPRWEVDAGGAGPLARIMGRKEANPRFEHKAALQLVRHLLAHPEAAPGVPQLARELPEGAALDWEHRRARLKEILGTDRTPAAGTRIPVPDPVPAPPEPYRDSYPEQPYAGEPYAEQGYAEEGYAEQPYAEQGYAKEGYAEQPYGKRPYAERQPEPYEDLAAAPGPRGHDARALHESLRVHQRGDVMGQSVLLTELRGQPDELLLHELRSGELPLQSVELLLTVLGDPDRVQARPQKLRLELCAEVLDKDLYFTPHGPTADGRSGAGRASRAAHLFAWAVAPSARELRDLELGRLQEFLERMSRDSHPTTGNWFRQTFVKPPNGRFPDLPPAVWGQLLGNALLRSDRPHAAPPVPQVSPVPPQSPPRLPEQRLIAKLSGAMGGPGCVLGGGLAFCLIGLLVVVVWLVS